MINNKWINIAWHIFVWLISIASIIEVIIGFIPISGELETGLKIFFMGVAFVGLFYEIINHLFNRFEAHNDLNRILENGLLLSKDDRIPDYRILEIENDLDTFFNYKKGSYHIVVISACIDTNEYLYMKTIWNNINKGVQYLYVTPATDQGFINELISLFSQEQFGNLSTIYKMVIDRISHISKPELFEILPSEFDMCIYLKDYNNQISNIDGRGFFSVYGVRDIDNRVIYYYYPITDELLNKIYNKYANSFYSERIIQSYMSKKTEIKNSSIHGKGLFCKAGECIKKGEIVVIKGGYELHRKELSTKSEIDSYLPIGDDLFLGAKKADEEELVKIYINHSCVPNVGMEGDRTFIAIKDICEGEELVIDYAFIDNEKYSFQCTCGSKCCRKVIGGFDWMDKQIQKKYKKYFAKYLREKM